MTVQLLSEPNFGYMGLSTDGKPSAGVPYSSYFKELDTGLVYVFDGSTWHNTAGTAQYPISADGDSVYEKDVKSSLTDDGTFTGEDIGSLFNDLDSSITDTSATNPKYFQFFLERPIRTGEITLVAETGNFSNVKVTFKDRQGTVLRSPEDESAISTKYTSRSYDVSEVSNVCCIRVEFHTTDTITLSFVYLRKSGTVSLDQRETTTNSLKVMNYAHSEIHSGDRYFYRGYHSLAKDGAHDHLIVTPDTTRWAHMTIAIEGITSSIVAELFEDATTSDDGAVATARNRNRNFPDASTTLVYEAPTITDAGTSIGVSYLGAGKGSGGGEARDAEEILLKQNAKYLFRVTEQNIDATVINLVFDWYEHTNL